MRVIAGEMSRMSDHYLCLGAMALELAAMTPFLYLLEARELICDLLDALCGARVTTNYIRIGGVSADLPEASIASPASASIVRWSCSATPTSCSPRTRFFASAWRAPAIWRPRC